MCVPEIMSVCAATSVNVHECVYMCTCAYIYLFCLLVNASMLANVLFSSNLGYLVAPGNCMLESASN